MVEYVLAIDEGTTNAKAVAISRQGRVLVRASRKLAVSHEGRGCVTQDAESIWRSVCDAITDCVAQLDGVLPCAFAISNQRESVIAWDGMTGEPVAPVLGWQDTRTEEACRRLRAVGVDDLVEQRTGLRLDSMFSAPKIGWLVDRFAGSTARLRIGTVDTWLVNRLTGGRTYVAEAGNASRTLLLDLDTCQWSDELCMAFGVPRDLLAPVVQSCGDFGETYGLDCLPDGIPIVGVLGDSHAALFGHGCWSAGMGKVTLGTGSSVMVAAGSERPCSRAVSTTLAWLTDEPFYGFEGNIVWAGSAMDWMARILDVDPGPKLDLLSAECSDSEGVCFVPAFTGLGAPWWDREASALIAGLRPDTSRAVLARAALESTCNQVADVVESMSSVDISCLFADGGPSRSATLMQIQADILGTEVKASVIEEASAMGAALMGFERLGWDKPMGIEDGAKSYIPGIDSARREAQRDRWKEMIAISRGASV